MVSLLMGVLLLFAFPIGTVFGIFLLWGAWKPWDEHEIPGAARGGWHKDAVIDRRKDQRRGSDRRGGGLR